MKQLLGQCHGEAMPSYNSNCTTNPRCNSNAPKDPPSNLEFLLGDSSLWLLPCLSFRVPQYLPTWYSQHIGAPLLWLLPCFCDNITPCLPMPTYKQHLKPSPLTTAMKSSAPRPVGWACSLLLVVRSRTTLQAEPGVQTVQNCTKPWRDRED